MPVSKRHRVLIATDGSAPARAALDAALRFPFSSSAQARAVFAHWPPPPTDSDEARAAAAQEAEIVAEEARRMLASRWSHADVAVLDEPPVDAILAEALRWKATLVVLGWRGHGTFRRLLAGSVSGAVAMCAECPVLVVRESPPGLRQFVLGYDGSPNAERAIDFLCSLEPERASRMVLVNVITPASPPASLRLLPASSRALIRHQVKAYVEEQTRAAQKTLAAGVVRLGDCGWTASGELRVGAPLEQLLAAARDHAADVLVLGARAASGLERLLLGSVANGALSRSLTSVLLVR
jgi:nucleotide-binding universal stress UspA family protein